MAGKLIYSGKDDDEQRRRLNHLRLCQAASDIWDIYPKAQGENVWDLALRRVALETYEDEADPHSRSLNAVEDGE